MKIETNYGIHSPIGSNHRIIIPAIAYVSTWSCLILGGAVSVVERLF